MRNDIAQWKEIEARVVNDRAFEWPKREPNKPFDYEAQARVRVPITSRWPMLRRAMERIIENPAYLHSNAGYGDFWSCGRCCWQCGG